MVFIATFFTISVILGWSALLMEEAFSHNAVSSKPRHQHDSNSQW